MSRPAHIVVDRCPDFPDDGVPWARVPQSELAEEWTSDRDAPRSDALPVFAAAAIASVLALLACVLG